MHLKAILKMLLFTITMYTLVGQVPMPEIRYAVVIEQDPFSSVVSHTKLASVKVFSRL